MDLKPAIIKALAKAAGRMAGWRFRARHALRSAGLGKPSGVEIWRGKSEIDGRPIVSVLTGLQSPSSNRKTGDVLQLWIFPQEESPSAAVRSGLDASVCGQCRHRPSLGGSCYVKAYEAPRAVWASWHSGRYPVVDAETLSALVDGALIRLGAWGDPAALPLSSVLPWIGSAGRVVGYTHQWHEPFALPWRGLCMASVDTPAERLRARAAGWRTFRIRPRGGSVETGETVCPYEVSGLQCAACMACDGMARPRARDVVVEVHGSAAKIRRFEGAQ
tara:strand:+ start:340 stop:1164 length:825 start_codon:yes stop_codon:yes gene_type:complete